MHVVAIKNFEHYGRRNCGDIFQVSDNVAKQLITKGLVRADTDDPPKQAAAGLRLSALPVAQVLPQTTVKKSKRGRPRKMVAV